MFDHLRKRAPHRPGPMLDLHPEIALPLMRSARGVRALAADICHVAGRADARGDPVDIAALGCRSTNPDGICAFADPARFIFVTPRRAVSLVVADLPPRP